MVQEKNKNRYLAIFYNYKETADELPKKYRGQFWELVLGYAFDGEESIKNDLEHCNKYVKIAFFSIKNLLKLNKKAGSQNGKSNNPSGLSKEGEPNLGANIGANLGPIPYIKENKIKEDKINNIQEGKYKFNGKVIKLNEKDYNTWRDEFTMIDIQKELTSLDDWYFENGVKDWFFRCKNELKKRHLEKCPRRLDGSIIEHPFPYL